MTVAMVVSTSQAWRYPEGWIKVCHGTRCLKGNLSMARTVLGKSRANDDEV
jgi:hypothetical protein